MFDAFVDQFPRFMTWDNWNFLFWAAVTTMEMTVIGIGLGFRVRLPSRLPAPHARMAVLARPGRDDLLHRVLSPGSLPGAAVSGAVHPPRAWGSTSACSRWHASASSSCRPPFWARLSAPGLESVHHNQWDAASVMNFSRLQTFRYVIVPQAWRVILPPAFAFFVMFVKGHLTDLPSRCPRAHPGRKVLQQQRLLGHLLLWDHPRDLLRAVLPSDPTGVVDGGKAAAQPAGRGPRPARRDHAGRTRGHSGGFVRARARLARTPDRRWRPQYCVPSITPAGRPASTTRCVPRGGSRLVACQEQGRLGNLLGLDDAPQSGALGIVLTDHGLHVATGQPGPLGHAHARAGRGDRAGAKRGSPLMPSAPSSSAADSVMPLTANLVAQ